MIATIRQNGIADSIISHGITDRYFLSVLLTGADVDPVFLGSIEMVSIHGTGFTESICTALVRCWHGNPCCDIGQNDRLQYAGRDRQDYVKTAKAKGLGETAIIIHHQLKNALIPIITVIGMDISSLLGGAVVCETIFSIQGNRKTDGRLHQTT